MRAVVNVKNSCNRQHNQIDSNDFVPDTVTENIRGKNFSNILLIHKFKIEQDFHDSKNINFDANIN